MARILILAQAYVPDPASTGQHLHDAAVELARRGHEVRVLAASRGYDDPRRRYPLRETRDGVKIRRLPLSSFGKGSIGVRVAGALSFVVQSAARAVCSRRFDAILVTSAPPLCPLAALVVSRLRGAPICYWIHDINPDQAVALGAVRAGAVPVRLMDRLNGWILARAARTVTLDRFMAERLRCKPGAPAHIEVLPPWPHAEPASDVAHESNPWRRAQAPGESRVVMYSGNHSLAHPLDTLLRAALRLGSGAGVEFLFVGSGLGKRAIDAAIARERPTHIRSLPYQPLDILHLSLAAADVHAVAVGDESVGISHPCKIYGAMAVGRPILLFGPERCHATEIMNGSAIGWRVAHNDIEAAVAALRAIGAAPRERLAEMGRGARELVRARYTAETLRARLCDQLEAALAHGPVAARAARRLDSSAGAP